MRTAGTFQEIYAAAKSYANGEEVYGGCPHNPVIRREGDRWMLESGLEPSDGDIEVTLEAFDNWFWESYKSDNFEITDEIINEFVAAHQPEDEY